MPISIPKFFQKAFAQNGGKQDVPITGDTSGGRASYDTGFPAITRIPIVAGGIPPFGTDFNGVLYDLSMAIQYLQSGVSFPFDQDFADAIGGYRIKAIVADPADPTILWQNNNADNTLPPSAPNGWTQVFSPAELLRDPTSALRGAPLQATQPQAEAGTNNANMMTALRVFQAMSAASSPVMGVSQTWQNLTGSRTSGVTYTNSTTKPRFIVITKTGTASSGTLEIAGVTIGSLSSTAISDVISAVVPVGATYKYTGTILSWTELG
jgi:hypothetical protein